MAFVHRSAVWRSLALLAAVGLSPLSAHGGGLFPDASEHAVGDQPAAVAGADLNADGVQDLVSVNAGSNNVTVLLGSGGGAFAAQTAVGVGSNPKGLAIGSLNAGDDDYPDVVVANSGDDTLSVLLGQGDGTLAPSVDYAVSNGPRAVACGDLTGDGHRELVAANYTSGTLSVLRGSATGVFEPMAEYAVGLLPSSAAIADMDRDGDLDVVVANEGSNNVVVLANAGDGALHAASILPVAQAPRSVVVADFNADTRPDIATANHGSNSVSVILAQAVGGYGVATAYEVHQGPASLVATDLDGDGLPDLAVANVESHDVSVLLNYGDAWLQVDGAYGAGEGPVSLAAVDADGDGDTDLAVADQQGDEVTLLSNLGNGSFAAPTAGLIGDDARALAAADVDGDLDVDLLIAYASSSVVSVFSNDGLGSLSLTASYPVASGPEAMIAADLNGDTIPDVATASPASGNVSVLLGLGGGAFAPAAHYAVAGEPCALAAARIDAGSGLDLVVACRASNSVCLLSNNGDGTFTVLRYTLVGGSPGAIAAADLNGDTFADVATANEATNDVSVLINLASGVFEPATHHSVGSAPRAIAAEDLNHDGLLDLAAANSSSDTVSVLWGTGAATFSAAEDYAVGDGPRALVVADLNGDSYVDLATADEGDGAASVLLNQGAGKSVFGVATQYGLGPAPGSLIAADLEGDGDADLAAASAQADSLFLLFNEDTTPIELKLSANEITVPEGGSASLSVGLSKPPSTVLVVSVARTGGDTDITASPATLVFSLDNWHVRQTVTLAAQEDVDATDGSTSFMVSSPLCANSPLVVTATERDADAVDLIVSSTALVVPEGQTSSVTARLTNQPAAAVTVSVVRVAGDTDLTAATASVTFGPGDWDVEQPITIAAAEDVDAANGAATFRLYAAECASCPMDLSATEVDNDTLRLVVAPAVLSIPEGGSGTFAVVLSNQPLSVATVTVSRVSGDTDLVPAASELTFALTNWDVPQTVFVAALEDDDLEAGAAVIRLDAPLCENSPVDVAAIEEDNDVLDLVVSPTSLVVPEGTDQTVAVSLSHQPVSTAAVTVAHVAGDPDLVHSPAALTFTPSNWSVPQTLTITALEDDDLESGAALFELTGAACANSPVAITAEEADNDALNLIVSPTALTVSEGGVVTFSVAFSNQPSTTVTMTIAKTTGDVGVMATPTSLTFTTLDWGTPQTVTITSLEDSDLLDDAAVFQVDSPVAVNAPIDVTVAEIDNDILNLVVSPAAMIVPEGDRETFAVQLTNVPGGLVTVAIARTVGDADLSVAPSSLIFTSLSWNVPQTVTVAATEDDDVVAGSATIEVSSPSAANSPVSVYAVESDNDSLELVVVPTALTVPEGGLDGFAVKLSKRPAATVTVTLQRVSGDTDLTVSPTALLFTTTNWSEPQAVVVSATEDEDVTNGAAVIEVRCADCANSPVTVDATEAENDALNLLVSTASLTIPEGGDQMLLVTLSNRPSADVTVTVTRASGDPDVTVSPATIILTAAEWQVPQVVTVTAGEDDDLVDGSAVIRLASEECDNSPVNVTATEQDDDTLNLVVAPLQIVVPEAGSQTFAISLSNQPLADVVVAVDQVVGDEDLSASPNEFVFTPADWAVPQTVTVSAADDLDSLDGSAAVRVVCEDCANSPIDVLAIEADDDRLELLVDPVALTIPEGGNELVTVALTARPPEALEVAIVRVSGDADLSASPATLTFTTAEWDQPQTVTISAAEDADEERGGAEFEVAAEAALNSPVSVAATENDNDAPPVAVAGGPYVTDEGTAVTLDGSGSTDSNGIIVAWEWDFNGDGVFDDAAGPVCEFMTRQDGLYAVNLLVTDNHGWLDIDTTLVTVNNVTPSPAFTWEVTGLTIEFTDRSSDPGNDLANWAWSFGDGVLSVERNPVHVYREEGTYTVVLGVSDDNDEHRVISREIKIVKEGQLPIGVWHESAGNPAVGEPAYRPVVVRNGPTYMMWYTVPAAPDEEAIILATSSDGEAWPAAETVLTMDQAWETQGVGSPMVILDAGLFKMWYKSVDEQGDHQIGYAVSEDGVSWTKYGLNPLSVDFEAEGPVWVLRAGLAYMMWYRPLGTDRLALATSPDGLNWRGESEGVLYPGTPGAWDAAGVQDCTVAHQEGWYHMWFTGTDEQGRMQIGYATSMDGMNWNKLPTNPVLGADEPGAKGFGLLNPAILLDTETARLWYTEQPSPETRRISLAAAIVYDVKLCGSADGARLGAAVAAADLNGDGADELIVSDPQASPAGRAQAGAVYAFFGRRALLRAQRPETPADLTIIGAEPGDQLGLGLAGGDLDADGKEELFIGAPNASPDGRPFAGAAYVILGQDTFPATIDLRETEAALTVKGRDLGGSLGRSLAAGDVDGDGYRDLLVGAPGAAPEGRLGAGTVFLVKGLGNLAARSPVTIDLDIDQPHGQVLGARVSDRLGTRVRAHDLNEDGLADLILSAPLADPLGREEAGLVAVLFSPVSLTGTRDLRFSPPDLTIRGPAPGDKAGEGLALSDVNGDGFVDLLVGAPDVDIDDLTNAGAVFGLYGPLAQSGSVDLGTEADLVVTAGAGRDRLGASLESADVNADGFADVLAGAPDADPGGRPNAGAVSLIYGNAAFNRVVDLRWQSADALLPGSGAGDHLGSGSATAVGDVNHDAIVDLFAGAPDSHPTGMAVVHLGSHTGANCTAEVHKDLPPGDAPPLALLGEIAIDFSTGSGGDLAIGRYDLTVPPQKRADTRFMTRYWHISTTITNFVGQMVVTYDESRLNGINEHNLALFRLHPAIETWVEYETVVDTAANTLTTQITPLNAFSLLAVGERETASLVELEELSAQDDGLSVTLTWSTTTETNIAGFDVLRSEELDGGFEALNAELLPTEGAPAVGHSYEYLDVDVERGVTYYYLVQSVDTTGRRIDHGPVTVFRPPMGDVNGDGSPTILDAYLVALYEAGLAELLPTQLLVADVDGSGQVDIVDALVIARMEAALD